MPVAAHVAADNPRFIPELSVQQGLRRLQGFGWNKESE
jgi:hypothetical protein